MLQPSDSDTTQVTKDDGEEVLMGNEPNNHFPSSKLSYANLIVMGNNSSTGNSSEDDSSLRSRSQPENSTTASNATPLGASLNLEGEHLLNTISKLSTSKQKPHDEIKDHTQVCVCSEPILSKITADIGVIVDNDPAFDNYLELLLYPGLWAILTYRIAHCLYYLLHTKEEDKKTSLQFFCCKVLQFIAKLMCILARSWTGIEIHPGAQIGKGFFIDHGSGVVIGETTIVGNYCTLYQGGKR